MLRSILSAISNAFIMITRFPVVDVFTYFFLIPSEYGLDLFAVLIV